MAADEHDHPSPDDPLPALRAQLDQMLASAPELARVIRGFYDAFIGAGFTERQALYLAACQMLQGPGPAP